MGSPPLLWDHMRREKCPPSEAHRQGAFWTGSPVLKQDYVVNPYGQVEKKLHDWDVLEPTKVIVDTPLLQFNKNRSVLEPQTPLVPAYVGEPPKTLYEPFDTCSYLVILSED